MRLCYVWCYQIYKHHTTHFIHVPHARTAVWIAHVLTPDSICSVAARSPSARSAPGGPAAWSARRAGCRAARRTTYCLWPAECVTERWTTQGWICGVALRRGRPGEKYILYIYMLKNLKRSAMISGIYTIYDFLCAFSSPPHPPENGAT